MTTWGLKMGAPVVLLHVMFVVGAFAGIAGTPVEQVNVDFAKT